MQPTKAQIEQTLIDIEYASAPDPLTDRIAYLEDALRKTRNALVIVVLMALLFGFMWAVQRWGW